jgi:hypothetical protein
VSDPEVTTDIAESSATETLTESIVQTGTVTPQKRKAGEQSPELPPAKRLAVTPAVQPPTPSPGKTPKKGYLRTRSKSSSSAVARSTVVRRIASPSSSSNPQGHEFLLVKSKTPPTGARAIAGKSSMKTPKARSAMTREELERDMDREARETNRNRPARLRWQTNTNDYGVNITDRCRFFTYDEPPWIQSPPLTQWFIDDYNLRGAKLDFISGKPILLSSSFFRFLQSAKVCLKANYVFFYN